MCYAIRNIGLVLLAGLWIAGCNRREPASTVVVTSPYLAAAVGEFLADPTAVESLAGPGTCPGHFAVSPGQIQRLTGSRLFLRFAFQSHFDEKLTPAVERGLRIQPVQTSAGMCVPETYLEVCRQVGEALRTAGLIDQAKLDERLQVVALRMDALDTELRAAVQQAGLEGAPVATASHQADFCRYLGLHVAAIVPPTDDPAMLQAVANMAREESVRIVIGNRPNGPRQPQWLAEALDGARVVMFANFPDPADGPAAFDTSVRGNVERLTAGAGQ